LLDATSIKCTPCRRVGGAKAMEKLLTEIERFREEGTLRPTETVVTKPGGEKASLITI